MLLRDKKFIWLLATCIFVVTIELLSISGHSLDSPYTAPFFLILILAVGYETLWKGLTALSRLNFKSINLLMLIAVCGAFYLGEYEEAAVVIALYTLAERLEDIGIAKSRSALESLIRQMPKEVVLKGEDAPKPIEEVKKNEVMVVRPGDMIPLDGVIVNGDSAVDESAITGEPIPRDKREGDQVFAGTLNIQGYLEARVAKEVEDTTLSKIEKVTKEATQAKAKTQKFIEQFAGIYTPAIMLLAFLTTFVPTLFFHQPFQPAFLNSLTLLVIACPCALVISTPISIYSAIGNASTQGVLIKGGVFLEALANVNAIAFDKTRTLTLGRPVVTDVIPMNGSTEEGLLACAAGIGTQSEHPLSKSIVAYAKEKGLIPHDVKNFESFAGKGTKADCLICDSSHHCLGKLQFILEEHDVPEEVVNMIKSLQQEGKTVILICTNESVSGLIALADEVREESRSTIEELKKMGIDPIMLTGDNAITAKTVADQVGITQVKAEMLPQDKSNAIKKLNEHYRKVAMVGDGVNDAPALALSSVGVTLGGIGSDTAVEAANMVVLSDHLSLIPKMIRLGKQTMRIIRFNTFLAILIKFFFVGLALIGMSNLALAIFADVGVTVLVILNSLRLTQESTYLSLLRS